MPNKLRMTLLIDELSHPDLYAHLTMIDGLRNRTERVRYLALKGLLLSDKGPTPNAGPPVPTLPEAQTQGESEHRPRPPDADTPDTSIDRTSQTIATPGVSVIPVDSQMVFPRPTSLSTKAPADEGSKTQNTSMGQALTDLNVDNGRESVNKPQEAQEEESVAARAARQMARAGLFGLPSGTKGKP